MAEKHYGDLIYLKKDIVCNNKRTGCLECSELSDFKHIPLSVQ